MMYNLAIARVMMMKKCIVLILLVLLCQACGTKGPLYIPERQYPQ